MAHASLRPNKIGLGAGVLDGLLDDILDLVPVVSVHTFDVAVEVLLDLPEHIPLLAVRHKRDGNTNAAETASTTDTVQISLVIGLTHALVVAKGLRNVLCEMTISVIALYNTQRMEHT